jgi:NYN domain
VQLRLGYLKEGTWQWQLDLLKALEEPPIDRAKFEDRFPIRPELRQKAVDTLIVIDLVRYADRRAMGRALVLAGDGDLVPAVQVAREAGVLITLVTPSRHSVSAKLRELADRLIEIPASDLRAILSRRRSGVQPHSSCSQAGRAAPFPRSSSRARPPLVRSSPGASPAGSSERNGVPENGQRIELDAPGRAPRRLDDRSIATSDGSGVDYTPFVEREQVGYIVRGPNGLRKIYLYPSRYDGAGEATVVLCIGEHGHPALDAVHAFYRPFAPEPSRSAGAAAPAAS